MQMAESPDRFISPRRSICGPGISPSVSGTSMWLCVSTPMVDRTMPPTRPSMPSSAHAVRKHGNAAAAIAEETRKRRRENPFAAQFIVFTVSVPPALLEMQARIP